MKVPDRQITYLVPKDGKFECPFYVRLDQVDPTVLQQAPSGDEGRALVRKYCLSVYLRSHGQTREILREAIAALRQKVERFEAEYKRCRELLAQTPQTITSQVESLELPQAGRRWQSFGWGVVLLVMTLLTWFNLSRFAANETQDWLSALMYAATFLALPLGAKLLLEEFPVGIHLRIHFGLFAVFLLSVLVLSVAFALNFGASPSVEQLMQNPGAAGSRDLRAQLLAQILLDIILGVAIYNKLRKSLCCGAKEITNPNWTARMSDAAALEKERLIAAETLGQHQGLLIQLENCLESFCLLGESYWRALEEQRQQVERDRQEEERDFQTRQAARREREEQRRQWAAPWQSPAKRNGKLVPLSNPNNRINQNHQEPSKP